MTEIEQKALALRLKQRAETYQWDSSTFFATDAEMMRQAASAIEQHEAFKREVSDAVEDYCGYVPPDCPSHPITRFILPKPKPDPLVAVMDDFMSMDGGCLEECVKQFRVALARQGLEVREKAGE